MDFLSKIHLLIVDDHAYVRAGIRAILRAAADVLRVDVMADLGVAFVADRVFLVGRVVGNG